MKYLFVPLLLVASMCWAGWIPLTGFNAPEEYIAVRHQTGDEIIIEVTLPGFDVQEILENGTSYHRISIPPYSGTSHEVGKPEMPLLGANVGIPENAVVNLEIVEAETEVLSGYHLYPFQEPTTDINEELPFAIDIDFYSKSVPFPEAIASISANKVWRDINLTNLCVYPFQYNPATKELTVYRKIVLRLDIQGTGGVITVPKRYDAMYRNAILNYEWMNVLTRAADIHYLAIIYDSYIDEAAPLTDWYRKKGFTIDVVPSSTAGSTSSQIKTYITNHYNTYNTDYVLLVGDVAQIPTYTGYSCPASDAWYSFITGNDFYAELAIGRFSASSPSTVTEMVNKQLTYDKNPPLGDWLIKSVLVAHGELYPGKYSQCKREIYNFPYTYFTPTMDTIMGALSGNNNAKVTTAINEGRNVVNYRGHGDTYIWWQWNYLNEHWQTSNVNALANGDMTSVVFNVACCCGDITVSECLSECWHRKNPGGAIASLGASNPSYTIPNHDYDKYFYRGYCDSTIWNVGWLTNYSSAVILPIHGGLAEENVKMYLWCGDPATEIWTAIPSPLAASHMAQVPLGPSSFDVTVTDGSNPVENALVCAWKDGETWESDFTNASGQVTLSINPTTPGTLFVTATAHDFLPYEGFALANTGPYCIYDDHTIDDNAGGNGDGVVSAYEAVSMPVTLRNIGVEPSRDVEATVRLHVSNSYVTLTDTFAAFGDIMADSSAVGSPPYGFSVAGNCPNGTLIEFEIEVTDSASNDWVHTFSETVHNPELTFEGQLLDDSGEWHPNGILNAGEAVDVTVSLKNTDAYAHATGVTAVLRIDDPYIVVTDSVATFPDMSPDETVDNSSNPYVVEALSTLPFDYEVSVELHVTADNCVETFGYDFLAGEREEEDPTGPDDYAYWAYDMYDTLYTECPSYGWEEVDPNYGGSGTDLVLGDNETKQVVLPFTFTYYGVDYDTISVCSNGWFAFGVTNDTDYRYYSPPDPLGPAAAVGVFWGSLDPSASGGVYTYYDSGLHAYIVEWSRVDHENTPGEETFQVLLYDPVYNPTVTGDGEIFCQYLYVTYPDNSMTAIEDETETLALLYQISDSYEPGSAPLADGFVCKFTTDPPEPLGVSEGVQVAVLPKVFGLHQSYPNPCGSHAFIRYQLPRRGKVSLCVYDVSGRMVEVAVDGMVAAGYHSVRLDTEAYASGVYFYRLAAGGKTFTRKMTVVK